jgi:outer membrane lipoprotein LolB
MPTSLRSLLRVALAFAIFLIAGCHHMTLTSAPKTLNTGFYSGKISLRTDSEPPSAWFASFELQGTANAGSLSLLSPLGTTLGTLRWSPSEALLQTPSDTQRFGNFEAALASLTGASVAPQALFNWLLGQAYAQEGWAVDLSQFGNNRISARRTSPLPNAQLTLVLSP